MTLSMLYLATCVLSSKPTFNCLQHALSIPAGFGHSSLWSIGFAAFAETRPGLFGDEAFSRRLSPSFIENFVVRPKPTVALRHLMSWALELGSIYRSLSKTCRKKSPINHYHASKLPYAKPFARVRKKSFLKTSINQAQTWAGEGRRKESPREFHRERYRFSALISTRTRSLRSCVATSKVKHNSSLQSWRGWPRRLDLFSRNCQILSCSRIFVK